jgi:hypothetical protein
VNDRRKEGRKGTNQAAVREALGWSERKGRNEKGKERRASAAHTALGVGALVREVIIYQTVDQKPKTTEDRIFIYCLINRQTSVLQTSIQRYNLKYP